MFRKAFDRALIPVFIAISVFPVWSFGQEDTHADNVAAPVKLLSPPYHATVQPRFDVLELRGTLGPYDIGMYLAVKDYISVFSAHYFYTRYLNDIPLRATKDGAVYTFSEPGGGVFKLSLNGDTGSAGQDLDFYNSVGLQGTWSDGIKTYPVKLGRSFERPWGKIGHWYDDVTYGTGMSDQDFEAMVGHFIHGVLTHNLDETADATSFPLSISGKKQILNKADLAKNWSAIFTSTFVHQIRNDAPHEMFVHDGEAMLGDGTVWFNAKGVVDINE